MDSSLLFDLLHVADAARVAESLGAVRAGAPHGRDLYKHDIYLNSVQGHTMNRVAGTGSLRPGVDREFPPFMSGEGEHTRN